MGTSSDDAPGAVERRNVDLVGYDDLEGRRNAFKLAVQEVDGRWYCYLAHFWDCGWSIVDVTDPSDPTYVRFVEGPANTQTTQIQVVDGTMVVNLEPPFAHDGAPDRVLGESVFDPHEPATTGAYVFDVSDPEAPVRRGFYETVGGTHRNHYDGGDHAYMTAHVEGFDGAILTVVDVSDPTAPTEVGRAWWPGQGPGEDAAEEGEGVWFHGPAYPDSAGDPDVAYLGYGRVGMVTADVSDPTDPHFVHRLDFGDVGATGVSTHSAVRFPGTDVVWTSSEQTAEGTDGVWTAVFAVDKSDPEDAEILGVLPTPTPEPGLPYDTYYEKGGRFGPHNQYHYQYHEDYYRPTDVLAHTWFNAGLRLFDVSNPRAPVEVGYYVPEDPEVRIGSLPRQRLVTQSEDVLVDARGYAHLTDKNHGLLVLSSDLL